MFDFSPLFISYVPFCVPQIHAVFVNIFFSYVYERKKINFIITFEIVNSISSCFICFLVFLYVAVSRRLYESYIFIRFWKKFDNFWSNGSTRCLRLQIRQSSKVVSEHISFLVSFIYRGNLVTLSSARYSTVL